MFILDVLVSCAFSECFRAHLLLAAEQLKRDLMDLPGLSRIELEGDTKESVKILVGKLKENRLKDRFRTLKDSVRGLFDDISVLFDPKRPAEPLTGGDGAPAKVTATKFGTAEFFRKAGAS